MTRHINNWNLPSGSSLSSTWSRRSQFGKSKFTRIIRFLIGLIVFMLVLCSIFPLIKYSNAGEGLSGVVGILTVPEKIARRKLLRSTYMTNVPMRENFKIYFVFCKPDEKIKWILAEEQRLHNDIIIMDCVENMNEGKTYTWFKTAYSQFNPSNGRSSDGVKYDYVFKADDDVSKSIFLFKAHSLILLLKTEGLGAHSQLNKVFPKHRAVESVLWSIERRRTLHGGHALRNVLGSC